jgi:hypothetical protein
LLDGNCFVDDKFFVIEVDFKPVLTIPFFITFLSAEISFKIWPVFFAEGSLLEAYYLITQIFSAEKCTFLLFYASFLFFSSDRLPLPWLFRMIDFLLEDLLKLFCSFISGSGLKRF